MKCTLEKIQECYTDSDLEKFKILNKQIAK